MQEGWLAGKEVFWLMLDECCGDLTGKRAGGRGSGSRLWIGLLSGKRKAIMLRKETSLSMICLRIDENGGQPLCLLEKRGLRCGGGKR